jgi:PAS domain S-box-containing protein
MGTADNPVSKPIRILAVDDNGAALYATSRILRSAGFEVVTANTGAGALAAAAGVDLIVLDVNLPDMDGFEVCRRLRASPGTARLPILHLSATFTQAADLVVGLEAGADSYLTRPVEPPVLIATVRTLLFARRADASRLNLDARLRTMFELAPIGIAIVDAALHYENVNAAYCTLVGCSAEELLERSFVEAPGRGWHAIAEAMLRNLEGTSRRHAEVPLTRRDGAAVRIDWRVARELASGSLFIVATDLTTRLQHEAEREQLLASERAARAEAERGNRLKEEFLATLSHELRNPLNAILGWANVLALSKDLSPKTSAAVEAILRNGKLQATMIGDLLDYAGITFGKMRLVVAPVDPYAAVRAAIEVMRESARANGIELQSSFGPERLLVEADPERLQQIVWNLLSNAIKFSFKGGVVSVAAWKAEGCFRLTVTDRGKGISAEFLPRVFDRFSQADATTTRRHGGLGIGMAIVKQLVEMQGGTIEASSEGEGKGAVFSLSLPLSADDPLLSTGDSQPARTLDLSAATVLLVEDDDDAREFIRRILTDVGAQVIEAATGRAALECLKDSGANILLSDIGMADQDGYQLLREVRERGYNESALPAIALTAFARMEDRERALAAGFQDHLVKPIEAQTLVTRIGTLLRRRR